MLVEKEPLKRFSSVLHIEWTDSPGRHRFTGSIDMFPQLPSIVVSSLCDNE